ncbi:hypothetical protein [Priestia aryabhattai]|uniref:hypothetical protein n=1 Tax=Priestia aryabhattai TaxID=412384 RepID=UPI0024535948|nr:hypothetical protein [Priestia aryabhattai]MDH3113116.1 hypothetical protein [Priestia aryabhattai]MDH3127980.1 hypothetical protein [Priestia aryabhattai]
MEKAKVKKRNDLIGKKGEIVKKIEILDANEGIYGINVRVKDSEGEKYWVLMDNDISLD